MASDDFDDDAFDDAEDAAWEDDDSDEYPIFTDFVAERALAFSILAKKANQMEPGEIRDLSLNMLQALVRSIKTAPQAELVAVQQKAKDR
jgi:hypothetical protein